MLLCLYFSAMLILVSAGIAVGLECKLINTAGIRSICCPMGAVGVHARRSVSKVSLESRMENGLRPSLLSASLGSEKFLKQPRSPNGNYIVLVSWALRQVTHFLILG
ncbi:hypothetical protein P154DRAFT_309684 [Amniculicola lignicola CBS 123094]|uniref:Secreted protein n=1 Tax=Amniculicola lignicola CBS 123094 TaxID=1392246 RepID=A0A6A5W6D2_9PLEO|nr:hypothetical protein P154DRAFT_309684 [Amniculicola lignicola CBS 123094]